MSVRDAVIACAPLAMGRWTRRFEFATSWFVICSRFPGHYGLTEKMVLGFFCPA
jgi:hypothetical protein